MKVWHSHLKGIHVQQVLDHIQQQDKPLNPHMKKYQVLLNFEPVTAGGWIAVTVYTHRELIWKTAEL